jgi:hypothetical protein
MKKKLLATMLISLAALPMLGAAAATDKPAQCFYSSDWNGWKATPDSKAIYIRVGVNRIYRLDLAGACPTLQTPNARLITEMHGSASICGPLDINLSVSDGGDFKVPCIISDITALSPSEASALPKSMLP